MTSRIELKAEQKAQDIAEKAEQKAQDTADRFHKDEDAAEGYGTSWELHNVAADLEKLLVAVSEQDKQDKQSEE